MARIAAGIAAVLFLAAGAFLISRGSAADDSGLIENTPPPEMSAIAAADVYF